MLKLISFRFHFRKQIGSSVILRLIKKDSKLNENNNKKSWMQGDQRSNQTGKLRDNKRPDNKAKGFCKPDEKYIEKKKIFN